MILAIHIAILAAVFLCGWFARRDWDRARRPYRPRLDFSSLRSAEASPRILAPFSRHPLTQRNK